MPGEDFLNSQEIDVLSEEFELHFQKRALNPRYLRNQLYAKDETAIKNYEKEWLKVEENILRHCEMWSMYQQYALVVPKNMGIDSPQFLEFAIARMKTRGFSVEWENLDTSKQIKLIWSR